MEMVKQCHCSIGDGISNYKNGSSLKASKLYAVFKYKTNEPIWSYSCFR